MNMKKYLSLFLGTLLMSACTDEQDFDQIYLSRSSYAFDAVGGSMTVEVKSNATWSAEKEAQWLTLAPSEDRTSITLTATPNTTGKTRTAVVTFTAGAAEARRLSLTQQNEVFGGRFADLHDLASRPAFSCNGRFFASLVTEGYLEDGNTAIQAPVVVDALTGERRQLEGSTTYASLRAVSDDGQVIAINLGSSGGGTLLLKGDERITPEVAGHSGARVEAVSADGSVWVGYAQNTTTRAYAPIKWTNGTPEILPSPELNMRGTELRNGAMARGCSADGSVVYGSEWDSQGLLYWKNGQLRYPAQESAETKTILTSTMFGELVEVEVACYIRMTAEPYCMSPNGRYIGTGFHDYKSNGDDAPASEVVYPALVDTETGEVHIMKFESVTKQAKGMKADDEGYCYGNSTDAGNPQGWVYDYRGPSMTPVDEWMQSRYGVLIDQNRYILCVSGDKQIVGGWCVEKSQKAGSVYMGWFYVTPEGLSGQE